MISIVNYGLGNLGSIQNMLNYIGVPCRIVAKPEDLQDASKILLPGVGAFDAGMKTLQDGGWVEMLNKKAIAEKTPLLGICLGMQLMTEGSEEGVLPGLGWVKGRATKFRPEAGSRLKVPHMGWSDTQVIKASKLYPEPAQELRYYFVHSYYVQLADPSDELLRTDYVQDFTSGFMHDNLVGVQFHPEKSHRFGMTFLKAFANSF